MKHLLLFFLLILSFSCEKETEIDDTNEETISTISCDYNYGKFTLDNISLAYNRYKEGGKVFFVDAMQNSLVLDVTKIFRSTHEGRTVRLDYLPSGDTIFYCYNPDVLYVTLEAEDKSIKFDQSIHTALTGPKYSESDFSDMISIFVSYPSSGNSSYSVFHDLINIRNNSNPVKRSTFKSELNILGKLFLNVKYTDFSNSKDKLWFNQTEGIIAFTDEYGKMWRFDKVE